MILSQKMFLSESWIPIDHNLLLAILAGFLVLGAFYFVVKGRWRLSEFALVTIPAVLLMISVFIPGLSLPGFATDVPNEPIDFTIQIDARLKPWTFNITKIEDNSGVSVPIEPSKYEVIPAGTGYGETVAYQTLELQVGKVYKLMFKAIDTDHGVLFSDFPDYFGESIQLNLPQHKFVTTYLKPTSGDLGTHLYSCTFFCGAGHGQMNAQILVSP